MLAAVSEQIIVDQFGWRASDPRKVAIFADPINGQNAAVSYTPGATFQIRRASDNATVFTGNTVSWNGGATHSQSGDRVWYGDFSSLTAPGDYYVYDPTNDLQSYGFRLDDNLFSPVLATSVRTFYYQRCGTAIPAQYGGNWVHQTCHEGTNQDLAARQWVQGTGATGTARDVHGGWHDAGDMNKYVPFTTGVLWDLMQAYEWNPGAFPDTWNIPESGNAVPDILDEVKYELDWILRMQLADGSVCNRVAVTQYTSSSPPESETIARYYTQPTSWATASAAASFAHGARLFASYTSAYPGYATGLLNAAQNAWGWLAANPNMTPASGNDGGGSGGSNGGLAAAGGDGNANADRRLRVMAAAELFKTTGSATYRTYFDTWVKDASTFDGTHSPLVNNWFDATQSPEINRACVIYATAPGATTSLVNEIKGDLAGTLNSYLGNYNSGTDAYRGHMYDGHYCWGSNQIKAQWGNLFVYGIQLNVSPANTAAYREVAGEYLHYFHGRNPLSFVYLSNMGSKGANLGAEKSSMEFYHGWFAHGSSLYDGANSTYGPAPGFLVGGPNQYYAGSLASVKGLPPMKSYLDWNTGWPENSWEVTENAIYYQAAYTLLLSQFSGAATEQAAAPALSPAPGVYASAQNVTITTTTTGATIRYTTDGSIPSSTHGTIYTGPVAVSASMTLMAIAYKDGMAASPVASGAYTIGAQPPVYVYQDALASGWQDWSWDTTRSFANTSPVRNGTNSIAVTYTAGWAGLSLNNSTPLSTAGYSSIKFWVHGGTGSNKSLWVYVEPAAATPNPTYAFTATANTWTEITVPLAALGNPTSFGRITFQNASGSAQPTIYLDDIRLWADVVNQAPTDISLTPTSIAENQPVGAVVGTLSTTDPDAGNTFTYSLVSGTGSTDNASFTINGNQLRTAAVFDHEAKSSYAIRVRTTDQGGLWFEKAFAVGVTDVDEIAPVVSSCTINGGQTQRSMVKSVSLVFSEAVTLGSGAVTLLLASGLAVPGTALAVGNPSGDQRSYLLTFNGSAVVAGSLADGIYDLKVTASAVQDAAGNLLNANYTRRFHRLFGDINGDKRVNLIDYTRLRTTLGRASGHPLFEEAFDVDASGLVNVTDFGRFRRRFGAVFRY